MRRFLVFTLQFPPLALLVFIDSDPVSRRHLPTMESLIWMAQAACLVAMIPAALAAAVDGALSRKAPTSVWRHDAHRRNTAGPALPGRQGKEPVRNCRLRFGPR